MKTDLQLKKRIVYLTNEINRQFVLTAGKSFIKGDSVLKKDIEELDTPFDINQKIYNNKTILKIYEDKKKIKDYAAQDKIKKDEIDTKLNELVDVARDQPNLLRIVFKDIAEKVIGMVVLLHDKDLAADYYKELTRLQNQVAAQLTKLQQPEIPGLVPFKGGAAPSKPKAKGLYQNEYAKHCGLDDNRLIVSPNTEIDYLGLKNILNKLVEEQASQLYSGVPDITLDTLTLTVSFELSLDFTGGAATVFRLLPTLAPATFDFKPDHTHTLKVTLHGLKNKTPATARNLVESCRKRLGIGSSKTAPKDDVCGTEIGQLLESIANATSSSGSSNQ